jgi:pyruvate-formate lyase-activating enzyme
MYLRFVIPANDRDSGCRMGIFQAAFDLRNYGDLRPYEEDRLAEALDWFNRNLRAPRWRMPARRNHPAFRTICWYKADACEHITRMWDIAAILEQHDRPVSLIRTVRPGYIAYEDSYQVAAEPFSDTTV